MKEIFATNLEISLSLSLKHPEIANNILYMICHGLKRSENKRVFEKKPVLVETYRNTIIL